MAADRTIAACDEYIRPATEVYSMRYPECDFRGSSTEIAGQG